MRADPAARWIACLLALAVVATSAPSGAEAGAPPPDVLWVAIGDETFSLELALDPRARQRGLSGRAAIEPYGGMLFVLPRPRPFSMVMRDCPVPIDVAFLDAEARVVAIHEMHPEPARRADETAARYEGRLPEYPSGVPVQFAIEVAGGRLGELGLRVGQRIALDTATLTAWAR